MQMVKGAFRGATFQNRKCPKFRKFQISFSAAWRSLRFSCLRAAPFRRDIVKHQRSLHHSAPVLDSARGSCSRYSLNKLSRPQPRSWLLRQTRPTTAATALSSSGTGKTTSIQEFCRAPERVLEKALGWIRLLACLRNALHSIIVSAGPKRYG
jgi:hypothetical protein